MSEGRFTAEAAELWGGIPKEARERILANVHCAKCGRKVVRAVETSESDHPGN